MNDFSRLWKQAFLSTYESLFEVGRVGRQETDNTYTILVPNKANRIYVTLGAARPTGIIEAINLHVPRKAGIPVKLLKLSHVYIVWGIDESSPSYVDGMYNVAYHHHGTGTGLEAPAGEGNPTSFLGLSDTPSFYSGAANKSVVVNAAQTGLDFGTPYTDEKAQDAVGTILVDSATIDFTYDDPTPSITGIVKDGSITNVKLANMAGATVKGRTYNDITGIPKDLTPLEQITLITTATGFVLDDAIIPNDLDSLILVRTAGLLPANLSWENLISAVVIGIDPFYISETELDNAIQELDAKVSVRVATTVNITLSGTQTIDGIAVIAGDRVLVKDQTTASQNGIYDVAAGAWSRSQDADTNFKVTSGIFTFVAEGAVNADRGYVLTTNDPITLDTTGLTFTQFSGTGMFLRIDGTTPLTGDWDIGSDRKILADTLQARTGGGLILRGSGGEFGAKITVTGGFTPFDNSGKPMVLWESVSLGNKLQMQMTRATSTTVVRGFHARVIMVGRVATVFTWGMWDIFVQGRNNQTIEYAVSSSFVSGATNIVTAVTQTSTNLTLSFDCGGINWNELTTSFIAFTPVTSLWTFTGSLVA